MTEQGGWIEESVGEGWCGAPEVVLYDVSAWGAAWRFGMGGAEQAGAWVYGAVFPMMSGTGGCEMGA